jgi:hypothetical protein
MQVQTTAAAFYYELGSIPLNRCFRFVKVDFWDKPSPFRVYYEQVYCIIKLGQVKEGQIPIMDLSTHEIHYVPEKALVIPLTPTEPIVFTDDLSYHHDPFIMGCWHQYTSD